MNFADKRTKLCFSKVLEENKIVSRERKEDIIGSEKVKNRGYLKRWLCNIKEKENLIIGGFWVLKE